jgi:predicted ribosome quality control (RQC) complex YloA/Tae2 family protein
LRFPVPNWLEKARNSALLLELTVPRSYTHYLDVSNPIPYDSLLVSYLARELDARLAQRRVRDLSLNATARRMVLVLDNEALVWELRPDRGWLLRADAPPVEDPGDARAGRVVLPRQARVAGVEAPADERALFIDLGGKGKGRTRRLVVELMTNQWNVLALDDAGRIVAALWPRDAGDRRLRPGASYAGPAQPAGPRQGREEPVSRDVWHAVLDTVPPRDRRRALVRTLAWTSPLNARAVLGAAAEDSAEAALAEAYDRYHRLASRPQAEPRVLERSRGPFPYPVPLPGVPGRPVASLLEGMAAASDAGGVAPALTPEAQARLRDRRDALAKRLARLRSELQRAPERATVLRHHADLLLARLRDVPTGADHVALEDFDGGVVDVELDPALSPARNADRLYEQAAKRERAARQLPALVQHAQAELQKLDRLLADAQAGRAEESVIRKVLANLETERSRGSTAAAPRLPYRRYRTSGGLEVRVGRGARANDALTFHHAAPDDVWLHARDVAGAHVVLRWAQRDQNPPRRDLHEAAALAAWHSRARTSGLVPVDWTRRKYVRKPRGAPPGLVRPERVQTVFVEPDGDLEPLRPE